MAALAEISAISAGTVRDPAKPGRRGRKAMGMYSSREAIASVMNHGRRRGTRLLNQAPANCMTSMIMGMPPSSPICISVAPRLRKKLVATGEATQQE